MWPPEDDLLTAWLDLIADADTAGDFAQLVLTPLERSLASRWPRADAHDLTAAAGDAVLALIKKPAIYDPTRSPLSAYLWLIASRRLSNRSATEARHYRGRIPWDGVELDVAARNTPPDEAAFDVVEWQPLIAALCEVDARVFELMRGGERSTAAYAEVLGLAHLGESDRRAEVKRAKDRILMRLKRAARAGGDKHG